jgi:hypothetical protein
MRRLIRKLLCKFGRHDIKFHYHTTGWWRERCRYCNYTKYGGA